MREDAAASRELNSRPKNVLQRSLEDASSTPRETIARESLDADSRE
jgi:hypothetical protein